MKIIARLILAAVPLFAAGLHAPAAADEAAACPVPGKSLNPVPSTHMLIPYPAISQRLNETGATRVAVSIGTDGVPTDVTVTRSSGSQRLDNAVVTFVKARWRWQPPLEDCKPASAQESVIVVWHLGPPPKADIVLAMPQADYPPGAAEQPEAGDTYLELTLGDGGVVKDSRVAYGSGYPDLDEKALAFMKAVPGIMAGKPAGTEIALARWVLPKQQGKGLETVVIYAQRLLMFP